MPRATPNNKETKTKRASNKKVKSDKLTLARYVDDPKFKNLELADSDFRSVKPASAIVASDTRNGTTNASLDSLTAKFFPADILAEHKSKSAKSYKAVAASHQDNNEDDVEVKLVKGVKNNDQDADVMRPRSVIISKGRVLGSQG